MTIATHRFAARDGTVLAWHETGQGRPVVLVHGLFSNAQVNWIKFGHAGRLASAGFRVIMPDMRGHGESAAPHDPAAWPADVLATDGLDLIAHLALAPGAFDLGGYSLGGRTALRMVLAGARPRRLAIAGMGLGGMLDTGARAAHFRHVLTNIGRHPRGSPEFLAEAFLRTNGGDPQAMLALLGSFVDTDASALAELDLPTLVVAGIDDDDNGGAPALANALPFAEYRSIPGNHMSAVARPELGDTLQAFFR